MAQGHHPTPPPPQKKTPQTNKQITKKTNHKQKTKPAGIELMTSRSKIDNLTDCATLLDLNETLRWNTTPTFYFMADY